MTNVSSVRLMIDLRMNLAKNLLVNTDTSVGQIAEACGYDNVYYFSNVFKKEVGNAPLRFRQNAML